MPREEAPCSPTPNPDVGSSLTSSGPLTRTAVPMDETDELSESPDVLVGEIVGGKYQIVAFMDRGAIGAVFKAIQLSVGREVVLKVLRPKVSVFEADPNFAARFRREAATYGKLRHPNTVTLFDYGEHEHAGTRLYYMAMEFVRGRTLRKVLKLDGRFRWERAIEIALQVLPSLKEAHSLGIVHRDLKPGNVMITDSDEGERVKVLDFGVAKVLADETGTTEDALTQTGTLLGSPHYMAPEQMRVGKVDGRTDIYALGCILFEMLAGMPPFRGNGVIEICAAHLSKPVPSLEAVARTPLEVSPELEAIVRKCLEKDPEARFQTVEEGPSIAARRRRSRRCARPIPGVRCRCSGSR
jgi:eukaryotic-like serine/threonine-protein kinase